MGWIHQKQIPASTEWRIKMKCFDCGHENETGAEFCSNCGAALASDKFCLKCGSELVEGADFCPSCGQPIKEKSERVNGSSNSFNNLFGAVKHTLSNLKLSFKPVWLIGGLVLVVLLIAVVSLIFRVPKACRPIDRAIRGTDYEYGCNDETCVIWLQNVAAIPNFSLKYHWDGGESGVGECKVDAASPNLLACAFPPSKSEGGVLLSGCDQECESTPIIYLEGDEIASLKQQSSQQNEAQCGAFSADLESAIQQYGLLYEYDPLYFTFQLGGMEQYEDIEMRYAWGNGVSGKSQCWHSPDGFHYCSIVSDSTTTELNIWIQNEGCERYVHKFNAAELDWDQFSSCSAEFVDTMRALEGSLRFLCHENDCSVGFSGSAIFKDAKILYSLNGSQEKRYGEKCEWDDSDPDFLVLACSLPFEEVPNTISVYAELGDCMIYANTLDKNSILSAQVQN